MEAIAAAVNGHDLDAFVALHEPDAVIIVPPDGARAEGHDEIRKVLEPLFASSPSTVIDLHGILKSDGMAMSHSHFTVCLTRPNGDQVEKRGMGTVVSRRQPDGSWRIVFDYPLRA
jgi:uncharacterized protein (TIGR02246 family)